MILKYFSIFPNISKFEKEKNVLKSCFLDSLPSGFSHFRKQLMAKSETCFGYKTLQNH